jgi:hypothetical protein
MYILVDVVEGSNEGFRDETRWIRGHTNGCLNTRRMKQEFGEDELGDCP